MRRWFVAAAEATAEVSARSELWVCGGLAWAVTAGPIALLAAVLGPPTASELTSVGAGAFVASAWPWNAVLVVIAGGLALVAVVCLVALADVAVLRLATEAPGDGRPAVLASLVAMLPAAAVLAVVVVMLPEAVVVEFTSPGHLGGGEVAGILARLAPLVALLVASTLVGGAYASVARQVAVGESGRRAVLAALGEAASRVAAAGPAGALHVVCGSLVRTGYLAFSAVLLAVLWAPIGEQLAINGGFGPGEAALLVGFVAIWLCLVAGGGAVHAWGTLTWARLGGSTRSVRDRETHTIP